MFTRPDVKKQLEDKQLAKGHTALLVVVPEKDTDDPATDTLVRELRKLNKEGLEAAVTGGPAYRLDIIDRIQNEIPDSLNFRYGNYLSRSAVCLSICPAPTESCTYEYAQSWELA